MNIQIDSDFFCKNGFIVIKNFYDIKRIKSIRNAISDIIKIKSLDHGVFVSDDPLYNMNYAFMDLIKIDRNQGALIYDAIKQIPEFVRLISDEKNEILFSMLRKNSLPGLAKNGDGIRIDIPYEDKYMAPWHQEFPAQLRSLDGIVFWSPLIEMSKDLGPVEIAAKSHIDGLKKVYHEKNKKDAYGLRISDENLIDKKYDIVSPLANPGDLILMDFLTIHKSGENISKTPRWSMQFRYFNFNDKIGKEINWTGSFASGKRFEDIIPSLLDHSKENGEI